MNGDILFGVAAKARKRGNRRKNMNPHPVTREPATGKDNVQPREREDEKRQREISASAGLSPLRGDAERDGREGTVQRG